MYKFQGLNFDTYITGGAPLLDMLVDDVKQSNGGWAYPDLDLLKDLQYERCVSYNTLDNHKFMEILISEEDDEKVHEFNKFIADGIKADMKYHSKVLKIVKGKCQPFGFIWTPFMSITSPTPPPPSPPTR